MRLSICIPTYNRKEKVVEQLRRLLRQVDTLEPGMIEVLVSDNCSDDGTADALKNESPLNGNVTIFTQTENKGLVGNLYYLFNTAIGQYIWFLSDDDPLRDDSVTHVLNLINNTEKDFYLLNFDTDTSDGPYWNNVSNYFELLSDKNWGGLGLLSAQILKKSKFIEFYEDSSKKYNLCQPVAVSLYGLLYIDGMVSFDYSYLRHHVGDYSWEKDSMRVFSVFLLDSIKMLRCYNKTEVYDGIINQLKQMNIFCFNSLLYLVRKRDFNYLKALMKEKVLFAVLQSGLKTAVKKVYDIF